MKRTGTRTIGTYRAYNFRTKDPVIDRLRTGLQNRGWDCDELARETGLSKNCCRAIFEGPTRSPRFSTVARIAIALGRPGMAVAAAEWAV